MKAKIKTPNLAKSVQDDIKKQFLKNFDQFSRDACIQFLFLLRFKGKCGQKKLERFANDFMQLQKELKERYELEDNDTPWLCEELLKRSGIDVEKILRGSGSNDSTEGNQVF